MRKLAEILNIKCGGTYNYHGGLKFFSPVKVALLIIL